MIIVQTLFPYLRRNKDRIAARIVHGSVGEHEVEIAFELSC